MILFELLQKTQSQKNRLDRSEGIDAVLMFILMTRTMTNIIFLLTSLRQELHWSPVQSFIENPGAQLVLYAWRWHSLIFLFNQNTVLNCYYFKKQPYLRKARLKVDNHKKKWAYQLN
jgi:hypothetical protein